MYMFSSVKRIHLGIGTVVKVGDEARLLGGSKALLITDPIVVKVGLVDKVLASLQDAGISYEVWDKVEPEPSFDVAESVKEKLIGNDFNVVIGVGGGSSLDTAKAAAVFAREPGTIKSFIGKPIPKRMLPLILIPTTAGTGAEVSNLVVLSSQDEEFKYAVYGFSFYPDVVIEDANMTATMPRQVTANTGLDALCHAIEAYVSLEASPITDLFAVEAIRLINKHLRKAYVNGKDIDARYGMIKAALFAGLAFGNAGTVLGHAVGYAHAHVHHFPHGKTVAITMPYVLGYNAPANVRKHVKIANLLGEPVKDIPAKEASLKAAVAFKKLLEDLDMPTNLKVTGVKKEAIPDLAERVFKSPKHVARNPRKPTIEDMIKLFENAYEGILSDGYA